MAELKRKFIKLLKILSPSFNMKPESFRGFSAPFKFIYDVCIAFLDRLIRVFANLFLRRSQISKLLEVSFYKIVPDILDSNSIVYSCGVGNNIDFDIEINRLYGCKVHLFDPTPGAIDFMSSKSDDPRFIFKPWGIWTENKKMRFYFDRTRKQRNLSVTNYFNTSDYIEADCFSIENIMKNLGHKSVDLLKLDIEGAGMAVIHQLISSTVIRPQIIIAELEMPQMIYGATLSDILKFISQKRALFDLLESAGYSVATYGKAEFVAYFDTGNRKIKRSLFYKFINKANLLKKYFIQKYFKFIVLRKMRFEKMPCNICGNDSKFRIIYPRDRYGLAVKVSRCEVCGLIAMRPSLTKDSMDLFYSSKMYRGLYLGILSADNKNNDNAYQKAKIHSDFIDSLDVNFGGNVLDIGSAFGAFLLEYKSRHHDVNIFGVEPGSNFKYFNADKFKMIFQSIEEIPKDTKFSLITMWHVLEHVHDARDFLSKVSALLSPGGRFIIEVPDFDKYNNSIKFIHIAHNYHFNRDSLTRLGKLAGLEVEKFSDDFCIPGSAGIKVVYRKK